ncbi:phosphoribosyltransferase [Microseira wollei]|uniref:Phosphoribosyltransferase n=1 Tax=Microseira wollei NIES-4236 TaxID=2530354 RepID=A0AAV3XTI9_9CYAN|nr:phosphoribosyltransferase [Microseira wollei]GET44020.1 phosphoribosyltransferase [Microseira wollei NIES-4236]
MRRFRNRTEAGQQLAKKLSAYANRTDVLVLGLPRGGVPVAYEVAVALNLPLDICLVRKLGAPGNKELAMGAIGMGGVMVLNHDVVESLQVSTQAIARVVALEEKELERRDRAYRGERPFPDLQGLSIVLVDDGIATGATLRAAIATLRQQQPARIIVAVPVAPLSTYNELKAEVDEVVSLVTPERFYSISVWYDQFDQTTDEEVRHLLLERPSVISY